MFIKELEFSPVFSILLTKYLILSLKVVTVLYMEFFFAIFPICIFYVVLWICPILHCIYMNLKEPFPLLTDVPG